MNQDKAKEVDAGQIIGHFHCIAGEHEHKRDCNSSDALAVYQHESEDETWYDSYCYSCNQYFNKEETHNSSVAVNLGIKDGVVVEKKSFNVRPKPQPMTKEEVKDFIKKTGYKSNNYRGIRDDVSQFFGHLTKLDNNGNVIARYYPETQGTNVTGYKCRNHPKNFNYGKLGLTGQTCDLSGQIKFKGHSKYVLIVGGCEDKAAAYQMLIDNQKDRGQSDFEPIAVVSPTTGEPSAYKQVAAQYDWLDTFEYIVIGMDNDEAGKAATAKIVSVLPEDKVKIAVWSGKDPNQMLNDGKAKQFVRDFYGAKNYNNDGVISSVSADCEIEEELSRPKIPLPDFMQDLQHKMAGGIPLGYWVNWIAMTGIGKSTTINEAIRKWVYESPYKVGILSLELTAAQYMIAMLSREVGHKINLIEKPEDAISFVNQPHVLKARDHLRQDEHGNERFVILDDREGSLNHVKSQIEKLIKKHNCKLIVIDPLNDLFDGATNEEQAGFIKWMKIIIKTGVTFCCICHVRKGATSTTKDGKRVNREISEDDVSGLSLITKSAGANIILNRDKYSEDDIVRNTTTVMVAKMRWTGVTGPAGKWYYCNQQHTMYDYNTYFNQSGNNNPRTTIDPDKEVTELINSGIVEVEEQSF